MSIDNIEPSLVAEFVRLVIDAVAEGLKTLEPIAKEDENRAWYLKSIKSHSPWFEINYASNGLPKFSQMFFNADPKDYTSAFDASQLVKLTSLLKLHVFVQENMEIGNRLVPIIERLNIEPNRFFEINRFLEIQIDISVLELIDCYVHTYSTFEFDKEKLFDIFRPLIHALFSEKLGCDFCFPVLCIKFSFDEIEISNGIRIEKISDNFQQQRRILISDNSNEESNVLGSATHWIVFKNWTVENPDIWSLKSSLGNLNLCQGPIEQADNFFACMRMITGFDTGYGQILARPNDDWTLEYTANLPYLNGSTIPKYPGWFESKDWDNVSIPVVDEEMTLKIGQLYTELQSATENKIHIAARRLNRCILRDDADDFVLDATIGLETLLTDDSRSEMTYKLAMRIAGLAKKSKRLDKTPYQIFDDVKEIYKHRSAIVHGNSKPENTREIKREDGITIPVSSLAYEYLCMVLRILIEKPEYRRPSNIDRDLLLGFETENAPSERFTEADNL